ncbi:Protein N-acetyltransferase, RimJ/RimL family [Limnobacter sp. 130]|uniref:GNAT family N-acetyltransferase n=1 Tax=Limnobacter sp. 130 TaxID=2653147 RepID=UPI0012EEE3E8|nr:GNAT family N-acetyltransferase [Limnobacter sp. 130]VWX34162.1 Protein N-acetyltransferase, RimJ/RimL family [Limnobacter sp. 130]
MIIADKQSNLIIRPLRRDDRDRLFCAVSESKNDISPWMSWCHDNYSIQDADEWISCCQENWALEKGDREFAVFDMTDFGLVGCVGINQINHVNRFANLGYWVRSTRKNAGLASAMARLAARFAIENLELVRLEIVVRQENLASRRVAEKIGAQFECNARNRLIYKGKPYDAALYSLLPDNLVNDRVAYPIDKDD